MRIVYPEAVEDVRHALDIVLHVFPELRTVLFALPVVQFNLVFAYFYLSPKVMQLI